MGFSGVIINLVLLATAQIVNYYKSPFLFLLIFASVFIFLSIIFTIPVIIGKRINITDPHELIKDFKNEPVDSTLLSLSMCIANSCNELSEKIKKINIFLTLALIFLLVGTFFVLLFTVIFIVYNLCI